MEIEIESKKNNPLLNRTEVCFVIKHEGQGTPNRELIRTELAGKLNAKKENIIVSSITSSFGVNKTTGYAKVYSSVKNTKGLERQHILKRNKIGGEAKKEDKKPAEAEKPATEEKPQEEKPAEPAAEPETPAEDKPKEENNTADESEKPTEETVEEPPKEEKPAEEKADEGQPESDEEKKE